VERFTFCDDRVRGKLSGASLLKADVTRKGPDDRALLKRFGLFGPHGTMSFDRQGQELDRTRVIGFHTSCFLETLRLAGL